LKLDQEVFQGKEFHLADGTSINSVASLANKLRIISDATFNYHVNSNKNDFANWVDHVYGNKALANEMKKAKTREWLRSILQKHMIEERKKLFAAKEDQEVIREKTQEAIMRITKESLVKKPVLNENKVITPPIVKKVEIKKTIPKISKTIHKKVVHKIKAKQKVAKMKPVLKKEKQKKIFRRKMEKTKIKQIKPKVEIIKVRKVIKKALPKTKKSHKPNVIITKSKFARTKVIPKIKTKFVYPKLRVPRAKVIPLEVYEPEPDKVRSFALEFGIGILFGIIIGYLISRFLL